MKTGRPLWLSQRKPISLWRGGVWGSQRGGGVDGGFSASIGDYVEGGVYAGVITINAVDYHIIFAEQEGEATAGLLWKTSTTVTPNTTDQYDGLSNTQAMEAAGIVSHPAASHCVNYSGGGFTDWYMPARYELALEANLRGHAEMSTDIETYRWSSTELNQYRPYSRRFSDGTEDTNFWKDRNVLRTRPIRRITA